MTYRGVELKGLPTYEMVREYITRMNFEISARKVFQHYSDNGWTTSKGSPVKSIESAINACNGEPACKNYRLSIEDSREEYQRLLHTQEWKDFSKSVRNYYGNKCEECGSTENLQVHHKAYIGKPKDCLPWGYYYHEMAVLCCECHKRAHKERIINKV